MPYISRETDLDKSGHFVPFTNDDFHPDGRVKGTSLAEKSEASLREIKALVAKFHSHLSSRS